VAHATAAAVKAEGSFYREQFNLAEDADLDELLAARIDEASAEVVDLVGEEAYGTENETVLAVLTTAEVYLATAKAFQTILNIMATWDAEALPTEFVDREALPRIIDRYRARASALLAPYVEGVRGGPRPYLASRAIAESADG